MVGVTSIECLTVDGFMVYEYNEDILCKLSASKKESEKGCRKGFVAMLCEYIECSRMMRQLLVNLWM